MTTTEIQEKINRLRRIYIDDKESNKFIDSVENNLRKAIGIKKLAELPEIITMIEDAVGRIKDINFLLAYDEKLSDEPAARKGLFREREVHQFWLERLDPKKAEEIITSLEHFIEEKL